ncbi:MAG TPA: bifunctional DNA-formamidopyrimidine glycosylase/DNA-(apurinic or apyrimidinic site) lyase [Burkholderiales bacterium]|jgi:formamidopyrimidine-DNA glycosylase|nr:bifunctional DNA-formamidopyrimidine glycosylase/DNA-(apurinic or apyrimidinic site) lyase [Burkholderiales bacterium]
MPELPEVEVTRRGIAPHLEGRTIANTVVRHHGMRWPVPAGLADTLRGLTVRKVGRRGKYLLLECVPGTGLPAKARKSRTKAGIPVTASQPATAKGWLILHLGMSGSLSMVEPGVAPGKHAHFDLTAGERTLRLNDPRRFGAVLWHPAGDGPPESHPLLAGLGVEPLTPAFTAGLLFRATRGRKASIKQVLLAGDIVVGVGNIYASESLFRARIRPTTAAGRLSLARFEKLVPQIRDVLADAIAKGGSTLRDFHSNGEAGYFQLDYFVYDRAGEPCKVCATPIRRVVQGQRSTFYCPACQR